MLITLFIGVAAIAPTERERGDKSVRSYIRRKLQILEQLGIRITSEQEKCLRSLKNTVQVDNFAHDLICR